jgi:hypothetical protein
MNNRSGFRYVSGLALSAMLAAIALSNGCSAANAISAAQQGCDEFAAGTAGSLSLDGDTKAFVQAGTDLVAAAKSIESGVLSACIAIDTDLAVTDTWTAKATTGKDDEMKEACAQAAAKIQSVLQAGQATATCVLAVSGGECTVDAQLQASCEAQCTGAASCTPPSVEVRCEPGQLSVQCMGTCNASATCEGSVTAKANCQGSCQADCAGTCTPGTAPSVHCEGTCMGMCTGTCTAMGGTGMAVNAAKCAGTCSGRCDAACVYDPGTPAHCEGSCNGTCTGSCKIDANANVMCGAMVSCKGGCTGMYTAPKCEGELKPPMCQANVDCQASCQSHAEFNASCTPPQASLECDGTASPDITKLIATLKTNLPVLLEAVQTQGPLAVKAAGHVATAGANVVAKVGTLTGKALACASSAFTASTSASVSISVSVSASASVSSSCGGPTS